MQKKRNEMIPAWLLERQASSVENSEKKNYVLANLRTVAKMLLYFSQSGPVTMKQRDFRVSGYSN